MRQFFNEFMREVVSPFSNPDMWKIITKNIFWAIIIIIIAMILIKIVNSAIEKFFLVRRKSNLSHSEKRDITLVKLLQNIAGYIIWFIVITTVLSNFGVKV